MSGWYVPQTQYKPIIRTLYAICQDAMSQRPSISPLYGRYMPYVRMLWPTEPVLAHYTDAICHMSGWYGPKTQYKPMIRTLFAICQDAMAQRHSISPLYGRNLPYVRMLWPTEPVLPIIRTLFAICQDGMVQRHSISPLYGRYLPYVRMLWPTEPVLPIIRTLYAICQDAMGQRHSISLLYGRYMPYVRMLCPTDPV